MKIAEEAVPQQGYQGIGQALALVGDAEYCGSKRVRRHGAVYYLLPW